MLPSLYYDSRWLEIKADEKSRELVEVYGLPEYMARHLSQYLKSDEIEDFLYPTEFLSIIPGTEEVAGILNQALGQDKKVLLFGDYDVDGISSVALMLSFLELNGLQADYYIPSRYEEGYGLTMEAIKELPETDLIITFDCGISSVEEVDYLQSQGVEVLITDHHQPGEELPSCPLINPQINGEFKDLAGVGVAYKLALYMAEVYGYEFSQDLIALAMLGTIADMMPLKGENRYLAKEGLRVFNQSDHPGFTALRQQIKGPVDAQDIGFRIAPMLNAEGRLGQAKDGLDLLLGQGDLQALVEKLANYNQKRKDEEKQVIKEALKRVESDKPILVVKGPWKKGVLGLAASRLSRAYSKPAIVLDEDYSGSARSIGNFSMIDALRANEKHLESYGGHLMAAGLKVKKEAYQDFKEDLYSYAEDTIDYLETRPSYSYIDIEASNVNLSLLDQLEFLAPYGLGNPQIIFRMSQLEYLETRSLGKTGRAFLVTFRAGDRRFEFLLFDAKKAASLKEGFYDILFTVEKDLFRDIMSIKLMMKDFRPSQASLRESALYKPFYQGLAQSLKNYRGEKLDFTSPDFEEDKIYRLGDKEFPREFPHPKSFKDHDKELLKDLPSRDDLVKIYSWLRKQGGKFSWDQPNRPFLAMTSLIIFEELGLISYTNKSGSCHYKITSKKNSLEKSLTYRKVQEIKEDMSESR